MWTNAFSNKYYKEELIEKKYILLPAIKNVLGKIKWLQLIDLGCGSGYYCRAFAGKNKKILGVDKNTIQLDIAIKEEEKQPLGISYTKSDLSNLESIKSDSFDVALLNFVIVEIASESIIKDIFNEAYRILKKDGILIIGQVHPHNINKKSLIVEKTMINKKDSYFNNGAKAISKTLLKNGQYLVFKEDYHYSLEFILNNLRKAGFILESIKELSYKEPYPTHILIVERK